MIHKVLFRILGVCRWLLSTENESSCNIVFSMSKVSYSHILICSFNVKKKGAHEQCGHE